MSDAPFKAPRNEDAMRCLGISEKVGLLAEKMVGRIAEAQCTYGEAMLLLRYAQELLDDARVSF